MILEARYIGPFPVVTVPGFSGKTVKQGETTTLRVPDGRPIGGCWEITKGAEEYRAALDKAESDVKAKGEARQEKARKVAEKVREQRNAVEKAHYLGLGEKDCTATADTEEKAVEEAKPATKKRGTK